MSTTVVAKHIGGFVYLFERTPYGERDGYHEHQLIRLEPGAARALLAQLEAVTVDAFGGRIAQVEQEIEKAEREVAAKQDHVARLRAELAALKDALR